MRMSALMHWSSKFHPTQGWHSAETGCKDPHNLRQPSESQMFNGTAVKHDPSPATMTFTPTVFRGEFFRTSRCTYPRELGSAVATLGNSSPLLDVQQSQVATGSLDDTGLVGPGVVPVRETGQ